MKATLTRHARLRAARRGHSAFTLLDLVVTLVILTVLLLLATATLLQVINTSKNNGATATALSAASDAVSLASQQNPLTIYGKDGYASDLYNASNNTGFIFTACGGPGDPTPTSSFDPNVNGETKGCLAHLVRKLEFFTQNLPGVFVSSLGLVDIKAHLALSTRRAASREHHTTYLTGALTWAQAVFDATSPKSRGAIDDELRKLLALLVKLNERGELYLFLTDPNIAHQQLVRAGPTTTKGQAEAVRVLSLGGRGQSPPTNCWVRRHCPQARRGSSRGTAWRLWGSPVHAPGPGGGCSHR
jgi:type II secretory pathway pseudopilin PulG